MSTSTNVVTAGNDVFASDPVLTTTSTRAATSLPNTCKTKSKPDVSVKSNDILSTISSLLKIQSTLEPNINTFYGDPLEFKYFITTFEEVVETKVDDNRGCLIRSIQFTSGEAKELIKGCIHLDSANGYQLAKAFAII